MKCCFFCSLWAFLALWQFQFQMLHVTTWKLSNMWDSSPLLSVLSLLKLQPQAHVVPITENLCNAMWIWMGIGWPLYFNTASLFLGELTVSSHFSYLRCFCFTTKFLKSKGGGGEQAAGSMHWGPGLGHLDHSSSREKATFGFYVSASQGIQKADVPEHSLGWVNYP